MEAALAFADAPIRVAIAVLATWNVGVTLVLWSLLRRLRDAEETSAALREHDEKLAHTLEAQAVRLEGVITKLERGNRRFEQLGERLAGVESELRANLQWLQRIRLPE